MPDNEITKIDWNALDNGWEEEYRKDYEHLFGQKVRTEYP